MVKRFVSADYKDTVGLLGEIQDAMEVLGIFMYQDPMVSDSDTFGFIFSDTEMRQEEIQAASDEHWDLSNEEVWGEGAEEGFEDIV